MVGEDDPTRKRLGRAAPTLHAVPSSPDELVAVLDERTLNTLGQLELLSRGQQGQAEVLAELQRELREVRRTVGETHVLTARVFAQLQLMGTARVLAELLAAGAIALAALCFVVITGRQVGQWLHWW